MPNYLSKRRIGYKKARVIAYKRAKGFCKCCKKKVPWEEYDAHHVIPRWLGGNDNPANIDVYHRTCHKKHHKKEKKQRRRWWGASLESKLR